MAYGRGKQIHYFWSLVQRLGSVEKHARALIDDEERSNGVSSSVMPS